MLRFAVGVLITVAALAACGGGKDSTAPATHNAPDDASGVWTGTDGRMAFEVDVPASDTMPGFVVFRAGADTVSLRLGEFRVTGDSCVIAYRYNATWEYRGAFVGANRIEEVNDRAAVLGVLSQKLHDGA
jgi:hypothetical protein